jgi:hypothetical protein
MPHIQASGCKDDAALGERPSERVGCGLQRAKRVGGGLVRGGRVFHLSARLDGQPARSDIDVGEDSGHGVEVEASYRPPAGVHTNRKYLCLDPHPAEYGIVRALREADLRDHIADICEACEGVGRDASYLREDPLLGRLHSGHPSAMTDQRLRRTATTVRGRAMLIPA